MKRKVAALLAAPFVVAGCTQSPADSPPPPHAKPNSNQNPDYDPR